MVSNMKTIKLYDKDSYINEFTTQVVSCTKCGSGYAVELCQTAFFPEGGGQPADTGFINDIAVTDVKIKDGVITHYTESAVSGTVKCTLNWEERFSRMQNHSGEHIVSGLVNKYTGFDNVSFQMNENEVSLGFSGELSEQLLQKIEKEANDAVIKNLKITSEYPEKKELEKMEYRSKLDLSENVRIVEIEGYDKCACCAPHCARTGQIGLIKIIDSYKYKGGTKLKIWCGYWALKDYSQRLREVRKVSRLLSAKQSEISVSVEKMLEENDNLKIQISTLLKEKIDALAKAVSPQNGSIVLFSELSGDDLRVFAEKAKDKVGKYFLALHGDDGSSYQYVLTSANCDISEITSKSNIALCGRGGGRDNMARGTYKASAKEIEEFFSSL